MSYWFSGFPFLFLSSFLFVFIFFPIWKGLIWICKASERFDISEVCVDIVVLKLLA